MKRLIFHIDVNSAFLSWESTRRVKNGEDDLRLIPSIIGGSPKSRRGVVLAKSIPAKQFHIKTGEPIGMALRKCPSLMIAPPDFKLYAACSKAFKDICRAYAPVVEEFSIDECFLDFTGTEHIYPNPIALAYEIKDKIRGELGFTVNVGSTFKDIDYTAENGEQKTICNRIVYAMTELTSAPNGQMFLVPEYEINMFWTNLGDSDDEIINLYHAHGECEQFHSEIKTDMGVERLPSGKFDTNELVLELTLIAYSILRMLGQEVDSVHQPKQRMGCGISGTYSALYTRLSFTDSGEI